MYATPLPTACSPRKGCNLFSSTARSSYRPRPQQARVAYTYAGSTKNAGNDHVSIGPASWYDAVACSGEFVRSNRWARDSRESVTNRGGGSNGCWANCRISSVTATCPARAICRAKYAPVAGARSTGRIRSKPRRPSIAASAFRPRACAIQAAMRSWCQAATGPPRRSTATRRRGSSSAAAAASEARSSRVPRSPPQRGGGCSDARCRRRRTGEFADERGLPPVTCTAAAARSRRLPHATVRRLRSREGVQVRRSAAQRRPSVGVAGGGEVNAGRFVSWPARCRSASKDCSSPRWMSSRTMTRPRSPAARRTSSVSSPRSLKRSSPVHLPRHRP